ncbi:LysM peptidoglycan-binding domain-containing protein [Cellulomonas persica]|uniref:LysM domain-containing protein n=1 Tax=Cellulomonas persica TaxID=76861 RepID=A0A510V190_9CELL|nr:LysM peptidoglycan-binding domain-containing protein [Cellulomonas persica]GEK18855.1 hypothetical protein CPE01_25880 [Cellulomonas persica]
MSTMVIGPSVPTIRGVRSSAGERGQAAAPAGLHLTRRGRAVVVVLALVVAAVAFALGARSAAGAPADVTVDRYVVQAGDTLWDIAAQSRGAGESVSAQVRELVRVNGLSGDQVVAGQEIVVPRG